MGAKSTLLQHRLVRVRFALDVLPFLLILIALTPGSARVARDLPHSGLRSKQTVWSALVLLASPGDAGTLMVKSGAATRPAGSIRSIMGNREWLVPRAQDW